MNSGWVLFLFAANLFVEQSNTLILFPSLVGVTTKIVEETQSKFVGISSNTSLRSLLDENQTFQGVRKTNKLDVFIEPPIWNVINALTDGRSKEIDDMRWIESVDDQLVRLLRKHDPDGRIAVFTLQTQNESIVENMVREKIRENGMQGMVFYFDHDVMKGEDDLQIWYIIQRAVELKLTTFALLLPQEYSMRVIEFVLATDLNNIDFTWMTINLSPKHLVYLQDQPITINNIEIQRSFKTEEFVKYVNHHKDLKTILTPWKFYDYNIQHIEWQKPTKITPPKYSLRFATKFYPPLVYELQHIQNEAGYCEVGLPCRKPIKSENGTLVCWKDVCCSGLIIEIFENVIKDMSIVYDLYVVADGTFGGFQNGKWTGIMNDVYTGKADVGIHAMSQLRERLDYVDFTEPILGSWFGIVQRREKPSLDPINWIFLSKLNLDLIVSIIVLFVVIFSFSLACETLIGQILRIKRFKTRDMFSYISGLLFQRDLGAKLPNFWSSRLPCICYAIAMTIIMSTYTANLTATNLVHEESEDFKGLSDEKITNPTNDFKFTVVKQTSYELWARKKPHIYQHLKDLMVPHDHAGLHNVLSGNLDAFISDWTFLKYLSQLPQFCQKLKLYKEKRKSIFSAFIVPKNSPWKEVFSQQILDLFESKKMEELLKRWLWYAKCGQAENDADAFTWRYFGGLFVFTGVSVIFVLIILLVENVVYCCLTKNA